MENKFELIYYNNPILEQVAEDITDFNDELESICEIMQKKNEIYDGIALAGNQVGLLKRIVALEPIDPFNKKICLINPKILSYSNKEVYFEEGCLSFPGLFIKIKRPESILVEYQLISGRKYQIEAKGILARVLQHEIDHLDGITFIKRVDDKTLKKIQKKLEEIDRKYNKKK